MHFNTLLICTLLLLVSCKDVDTRIDSAQKPLPKNTSKTEVSIIIQPFEGLPISTANIVASQLKEIYSGNVVVYNPIPLPVFALNHDKSRYRADSLISYLGTLVKNNQLIIGLTNKDISHTKGKASDYGIMGLGYSPGKSCVASTFRLKGKNQLEKLFKVAIHELGHTQGLARTNTKHCPEKTCLMRDANGKDHLNELKGFCSKCKPVLIRAGWKLK